MVRHLLQVKRAWALSTRFLEGYEVLVRVAVIGCGGVGLFLASALAVRGFVTTLFCLRDEDVVSIMRSDGVIRVYGPGEASAKVSAAHYSFLRRGYDLVVYATRLNVLGDVVEYVARRLPGAEHVFVQPSIDVMRLAGSKKLTWGFLALYTCIRRVGVGVAEWPGSGRVVVWSKGGLAGYIAEGLRLLGLEKREYGDASPLIWSFFATSLAIQPVSALLGIPVSRIARNDYAKNLVEQLWREAGLVAKEEEISLDKGMLDYMLSIRGCVPRMLQDLEQRIPTEIDYINGVLLREALGKGIYAPYNDAMYLLLKSLENEMRST